MLYQLLRQLAEDEGLQTPHDLAAALGTTRALVIQMAEHLVQQGYLREAPRCAEGCTDCTLKSLCQARSSGTRLWTLTEKGRQALARR